MSEEHLGYCVFTCVTTVKLIINKYSLWFAFWMNYLVKLREIFFQLKGSCGGHVTAWIQVVVEEEHLSQTNAFNSPLY